MHHCPYACVTNLVFPFHYTVKVNRFFDIASTKISAAQPNRMGQQVNMSMQIMFKMLQYLYDISILLGIDISYLTMSIRGFSPTCCNKVGSTQIV